MKVLLGRRYEFPAAHRLHSPALSDEENRATYGKCNNPFGHGHNYEVTVVVRGEVDAVTGRVADVARLDAVAESAFLSAFRYRDLNREITAIPTTENLTTEVERRLRAAWPSGFAELVKIRILETARNICEVGDEIR